VHNGETARGFRVGRVLFPGANAARPSTTFWRRPVLRRWASATTSLGGRASPDPWGFSGLAAARFGVFALPRPPAGKLARGSHSQQPVTGSKNAELWVQFIKKAAQAQCFEKNHRKPACRRNPVAAPENSASRASGRRRDCHPPCMPCFTPGRLSGWNSPDGAIGAPERAASDTVPLPQIVWFNWCLPAFLGGLS